MPTSKTDAAAESPVWTPADAGDPQTADTGDPAEAGSPQDVATVRLRRSGAVTTLLAIIALGATAGIAFAAGRATVSGTTTTGGNTIPVGNGAGAARPIAPDASFVPGQPALLGDRDGLGDGLGFRGGVNAIAGTVTAVGADSITLKLANGQTVTISTASTTTFHQRNVATSSDVTAGDTVVIAVAGGGLRGNDGAGAGSQVAADVTVTSE